MPFSITVNGNLYEDTHFAADKYFLNYPTFIRDCTEHLANSLTSYATTYGTSFTPANVKVAPGKAFCAGMPIVFYSSGSINLYFCTVTTYNSSTGAMTCVVENELLYEGVNERSDWSCAAGQTVSQILASYSGLTSLGYTTVADVKENSGQGMPATRIAAHFEDFTGYFPALATSGNSSAAVSSSIPGIFMYVSGEAKVTPNMNQLQSFCSSDCPGVIELSVTNKPDTCGIVGKGTNHANQNHYTTFRVYIPDPVEGEEIELHLGCASDPAVILGYDPVVGMDNLTGAFLSFNSLATPFKKKKLIEARYHSQYDAPDKGLGALYSKDDVWEEGRWLCVNFTKLASGLYSATVSDDLGTSVYTPDFPAAPTAGTLFHQCYPFILLSKKRGSRKSKVYVDYIGSGNPSTTRAEEF